VVGAANLEAGIEDEKMAGVVDDALVEPGNSWAERQCVLEQISGAIAEELERRATVMKGAYPFKITKGASLAYEPSKTGVYEFCLAAATNPTGEVAGVPKASAIFELIARDVLASHLGNGTSGFRAGAPTYEFEKRGNCARESFQALEQQCGEFHWNPEPGFPDDPSYKDLKDAGLDVVVWKPWPDGRRAHLFAIGQCACGKNDINVNKGRELSWTRLSNWLRPICYAAPLRCFFAAHHIPNTMQLYDLSKEAGIVFDRARIALIAEAHPDRVKSGEGINYHELAVMYTSPQVAQPALQQRPKTEEAAPRSQ
jgi:hypothetical protein